MLQRISPSVEFLAGRKVIKAEEYEALVDAKAIIAHAEAEASRILEAAKQEYEVQKQQGREDGLLEGRRQAAEHMVTTVSRTIEYFSSLEEKVVDVVLQALKKILGESEDRGIVVKVVRNALAVVRNQATVTLRVCPENHAEVEAHLNELLSQYPGISYLDVTPDPRLPRGGCILETEMGVIDASVEVQLEAICQSLRRSIKAPA